MKKLTLLSLFIAIVLLLTQLSSLAFAAPPEGKGPPTLEKMVFVHYRSDFAPGKPAGLPVKPSKTPELYVYNKIHWSYNIALAGINWYYDVTNSPLSNDAGAMDASFRAWDDVSDANISFVSKGNPDGLELAQSWGPYATRDGYNVVSWDDISSTYQGAIGVTIVWYYRVVREKIIVECDTVLNTNSQFAWSWESYSDPDTDFINNTALYDVDVQNIMTHEAGHWLMLGDMYDTVTAEQTMFGIAYDRELNKRTLEDGDIKGIQTIY